jgi:hypothetical protein
MHLGSMHQRAILLAGLWVLLLCSAAAVPAAAAAVVGDKQVTHNVSAKSVILFKACLCPASSGSWNVGCTWDVYCSALPQGKHPMSHASRGHVLPSTWPLDDIVAAGRLLV